VTSPKNPHSEGHTASGIRFL